MIAERGKQGWTWRRVQRSWNQRAMQVARTQARPCPAVKRTITQFILRAKATHGHIKGGAHGTHQHRAGREMGGDTAVLARAPWRRRRSVRARIAMASFSCKRCLTMPWSTMASATLRISLSVHLSTIPHRSSVHHVFHCASRQTRQAGRQAGKSEGGEGVRRGRGHPPAQRGMHRPQPTMCFDRGQPTPIGGFAPMPAGKRRPHAGRGQKTGSEGGRNAGLRQHGDWAWANAALADQQLTSHGPLLYAELLPTSDSTTIAANATATVMAP